MAEKKGKEEKATTAEEEAETREVLSWIRKYAREKKLAINPNDRQFTAVVRGLVRNRLRHGERYCPCRIRSGDPEKDRLIICPCTYHEKEIEGEGHCHCNLFFKPEGGK
jgi:ferredoxin-thioredoxin reductase catalytic subunit